MVELDIVSSTSLSILPLYVEGKEIPASCYLALREK